MELKGTPLSALGHRASCRNARTEVLQLSALGRPPARGSAHDNTVRDPSTKLRLPRTL